MRKNFLPNNGLPLFVDIENDLTAKEETLFDSWYVNSAIQCDGECFGIQWHHQSQQCGPAGTMVMAEFAIMNGTTHEYIPNAVTLPISENNGADRDKLNVYSPLGTLTGDRNKMYLKLNADNCALDVELVVNPEILINGTTGLLHFIGSDSYEFSYPNMDMNGTLTINGKTYEIKNQKAWFDRQWAFNSIDTESVLPIPGRKQLSWFWLGLNLNSEGTESISLWDAYGAKGRNAFATISTKDGRQKNVLADITYDDIWQSKTSGRHYPKKIFISIPEEDIKLELQSIIDNPESASDEISGCQDLCEVSGSYKGKDIKKLTVLEIVGDLCGED